MAILFISNVVPDSAEFHNAAFTRSGNNVVLGIANSLSETEDVTLITCRPIPSFPHGPLWISGEETMLDSGRKVKILPMVNMTVLKNLFWGISIYREVKKWAKEHAMKIEEFWYIIYILLLSHFFIGFVKKRVLNYLQFCMI